MKKGKLYLVAVVVGILAGASIGIMKAKATPALDETSGGDPFSVVYDEVWKATRALVSYQGGYDEVDLLNANGASTSKAAEFKKKDDVWQVSLFPKMVIKRWQVHGHIHFL